MSKRPRASRPQFSITVTLSESREVRLLIAEKGIEGPSEFWRRLLSEARGAGLPIVTPNARKA